MAGLSTQVSGSAGGESGKKKKTLKKGKPTPKSSERKSVKSQPGQMTREELERHLDAKQNSFGIEKAPTLLPMEIFSNDNSNPDRYLSAILERGESLSSGGCVMTHSNLI
ncbi:uncharacterized protein LOC124273831 isoform X1 [Haliotis rubra]|uniref:uncharacterized protein LOC124273831 isoform X1 n=1 Tax=Haliotis rubra TaxID=36100 RepID=UPI001EE5CF9A|nr:uncharacterized protein LOC124273831 isoform X1 [Haliotis rubra]